MKRNRNAISIFFLVAFILSIAAIPTINPSVQSLSLTNLGVLATNNILWNTTSDFNNYATNNCTIESGQLSLQKVNIAYDFTDDANGADPSGWYLFEYPNTHIDVINDLGGHNKVVEIYDNATLGLPWMTQYFANQTNGKIEFWLQTTSGWTSDRIFIKPAYTEDYPNSIGMGVPAFHIEIRNTGKVYIWGTWDGDLIGNWTDDTWHHFLVDFDCAIREVNVWFDGVYTGQYNFSTYFTYDQINQLTLYTTPDIMTGSYYIDAVDYSWTAGYFINRSYNYYGQKYYNNCIWNSTAQNLGVDKPYYNNLTFSGQTTANTFIYVSYAKSENGLGWSVWSAWSTTNISFNKIEKQYFRVRILLTTNDPLQTPVLDWINLCYTT